MSPISVSGLASLPEFWWLKWVRVAIMCWLGLLGIQWFRVIPRSATAAWLFLSVVYCLSAIWSSHPLEGLIFKGMFVCVAIAGVCLSGAMQSIDDYRTLLRITTTATLIGIVLLIAAAGLQTGPIFINTRLWVAEINPNVIAQSASIFIILGIMHLLIENADKWRRRVAVNCALLCGIIILSGSRAALLMAFSGFVVVIPVMRKSPSYTKLFNLLDAVTNLVFDS